MKVYSAENATYIQMCETDRMILGIKRLVVM